MTFLAFVAGILALGLIEVLFVALAGTLGLLRKPELEAEIRSRQDFAEAQVEAKVKSMLADYQAGTQKAVSHLDTNLQDVQVRLMKLELAYNQGDSPRLDRIPPGHEVVDSGLEGLQR